MSSPGSREGLGLGLLGCDGTRTFSHQVEEQQAQVDSGRPDSIHTTSPHLEGIWFHRLQRRSVPQQTSAFFDGVKNLEQSPGGQLSRTTFTFSSASEAETAESRRARYVDAV